MPGCTPASNLSSACETPLWRSSSAALLNRSCSPSLQLAKKQVRLGSSVTCQVSSEAINSRAGKFPQTRRQAISSSLAAALAILSNTFKPAHAGLIDEQQADDVFSTAGQSVVSIADYKVTGNQEEAEGTGSGFLWDKFGHVVTNYHVVAAAKQVNTANNTQVSSCCLCNCLKTCLWDF